MLSSRMENPEKPATLGTQNKDKTKTQYVLDTAIPKQTQITSIRHEPFYKQLEVKTNRTSNIVFMQESQRTPPHGTKNTQTQNRSE
jgi:hypothetical protein